MGMRGSHYALSPAHRQELLGADSDDAKFDYLLNLGDSDPQLTLETDKAWEALFRCFCEAGSVQECFERPRTDPLAMVYFGGEPISGDVVYGPIFLLEEGDVARISAALVPVDRQWLEERFGEYAQDAYAMGGNDDDIGYTWLWLSELKSFFDRAAKSRQSVAFVLA